jgi:hypothetical protein
MKNSVHFLNLGLWVLPLIGLLFPPLVQAHLLFLESFESDGQGTRYFVDTAFSDGDDDYFERFSLATAPSGLPAYTGFDGTSFWAGEDIDAPDNPTGNGIIEFDGIDLEGFSQITLSLQIAAGAPDVYDSNDDFLLFQYREEGGNWITALAFQNDGSTFNGALLQDTDLNLVGDGLQLGTAFQTVTSEVLSIAAESIDLRIDTLFNAGSETIAFDALTVTGVPEPAQASLFLGLIALCGLFHYRIYSRRTGTKSRA